MRKNKEFIKNMTVASLLCGGLAFFAGLGSLQWDTEKAFAADPVNAVFAMDSGASIKLTTETDANGVEYSGIRFSADVTKDYNDWLVKTYTVEGVAPTIEYRMLISPIASAEEETIELTVETANSYTINIPTQTDMSFETKETIEYACAMYGIPESSYDLRIQGRAFVKITKSDGSIAYEYATSADNIRSVRDVANAALIDDIVGNKTTNEKAGKFLNVGERTDEENGWVSLENGTGSAVINGLPDGQYTKAYLGAKRVTATVVDGVVSFELSENELANVANVKHSNYLSVFVSDENGGKDTVYSTKISKVDKVVANSTINGWLQADGVGSVSLVDTEKAYAYIGAKRVEATAANGKIALNLDDVSNLGLKEGSDYELSVLGNDNKLYTTKFKYVTKAIQNYADLVAIRNYASGYSLYGYYYLANDIDATNEEPYQGMALNFGGCLDGGYHTIKNLVMNYDDTRSQSAQYHAVELFASVSKGGVIKNLSFDNITLEVDNDSTYIFLWTLCGASNDGTVENVVLKLGSQAYRAFNGFTVTNTGTINNCIVDTIGVIEASWAMTAYIAGTNNGTITNCIANVVNNNVPLIATDNNSAATVAYKVANASKPVLIDAAEQYNLPEAIQNMYAKVEKDAIKGATMTETSIDWNGTMVDGYKMSVTINTLNQNAYNTKFAFTEDYIYDLQRSGVKAVKIWIKGSQFALVPGASMPVAGGTDWQGSATAWTAFNTGRRYYDANYSGGSSYNNGRYTFMDDVLTPSDLNDFEIQYFGSTTGTYEAQIYVQTFEDNYPVLSGISGYTNNQFAVCETIKETIDGQEVDTYRVSGISIPNSYAGANIGKGFCFSSAYIEELKAAGVKSVQIRYKTDGNAILYRGYLYSQADWTSKGWQAVAADWATMTTWESDGTISIDDLEKTHINFAYNGATATYIQLYLVLNY